MREVHYVSSMTFPIDSTKDTYELTLYVNSNVMGVQFGAGSSSNPATLTVDWSTAEEVKVSDKTSSQSANVKYTVDGGYEVKIPAEITVDPTIKKAEYVVEAQNFVIENGVLTNGSNSLSFTNVLESGKLEKTGDKLNGTVTVTDNASVAGEYAGTIDFTINFFAE